MMKSDPDICLCNPITDNFTTFEILIQTRNPAFTLRQSHTRRRYNDFCWLRKKLKKNHPMCKCPELPEKKKFSERFEIQFLVQRMKELEDWLHRIVDVDLYLSDSTLHLFLQSNLSCEQIEKYMSGNLPDLEVQQGYKEAELHLDTYIGTTDDLTSSMRGLSSPVSQENIPIDPVHIQTSLRASLHSTPERSDSGITEFESDTESSYDSQGSPYVTSIDSSTSEKYPPLTEVSKDSAYKISKNDSNTCVGGETSSSKDKVVKTKHKTSVQGEPKFVYNIKTIVSPDVCGTDVEINVRSTEKVKTVSNEITHKNTCMSERTKQNDKHEVEDGDNKTSMPNSETNNGSAKPKHKVEMGVLYC